MSDLIYDIKHALLKAAINAEPPEETVAQEGILDMMINEILVPSGRMPQEQTLQAISVTCTTMHPDARELPMEEIRGIIDDVKAQYASGKPPAPRRKPTPRPGM